MLPLSQEYEPMEATLAHELPKGRQWQYEPKWDGFRCLVFKDGAQVQLRSKSGQPLDRYFPEIVAAVLAIKARQCVLDGELVVRHGEHFAFDELLQRIHPAATRIGKLALQTPATLILFDLLVDAQGQSLAAQPLEKRRQALADFAAKYLRGNERIAVSPATTDFSAAGKWWKLVGEGLDGIVAKRLGIPYQSGNRKGMVKVKNVATADCVVGGFRYAENQPVLGSLLLGLYDEQGLLNHVGFTSSFKAEQRLSLLEKIKPFIGGEGFTGNKPGGPSRWSNRRSSEWVPLYPQLVVEVQYDHFTDRFRHGTKFLRFRPDKAPVSCTYEQVATPAKGTAHLLGYADAS